MTYLLKKYIDYFDMIFLYIYNIGFMLIVDYCLRQLILLLQAWAVCLILVAENPESYETVLTETVNGFGRWSFLFYLFTSLHLS